MPRTTRTHRRTGKTFGPEYARSLGIDEMPMGGSGRSWPPRKRLVGVIVGARIKMRWCEVARSGRAGARADAPLVAP